MKPAFYALLVLFAVSACNQPSQTESQKNHDSQFQTSNLDAYFSALAGLKKFNGAVLVHKDGKIVLRKAYNMQEDKSNSLYVNEESQFDIHSISKLMAKACIVKMEMANLIDREAKVSDFIPNFPEGNQISIQNLLDNQSGLPRNFSFQTESLIDKSPKEFVELIKKEKLLFAPGTETLYSNIGYQLIYFIISKIVNKPFVQYVHDEFFVPFDMNDSGAHFHMDKSNLTRAVVNHEESDGIAVVVPNYTKTSKNQARIYSTVDDLQKFMSEMKKEPYRTQLTNKAGSIGWSGGGDGILCHAEARLESGYELFFFSNYDEISFGGILADVEKIMTNKPFNIPQEVNRKPVSVDRSIIQNYVGKYDLAEFDHNEFEIKIEKDSVAIYQNGEWAGMLKAENDTTFFGNPTDEDYFVFRKGEDEKYNLIFKYKGIDILGKRKH